MASMQCYRPAEENCQTKCHSNSLGQKVSEIAGMVLNGNHHGHRGHHASNQGGLYYGQSHGSHHHSDHHAVSETETYYSETQTHYPDQYAMGKTQSTHCMSQSGHGGPGHHAMGMGHDNSRHMGQQWAHGRSGGCHEKKMMNNCEFKKKKKNHFGHKHRDGNRSCSESESDSDCD